MFIDIPCSEITSEFFEEHCLRDNKCCIVRNCNEHTDTTPLRRALCALELHVGAKSDDDLLLHLRKQCNSELDLLQRYDRDVMSLAADDDDDDDRLIKDCEFPIETQPGEYETMSLEMFFRGIGGGHLFLDLLRPHQDDDDDDDESSTRKQQQSCYYLKDFHFVDFWTRICKRANQQQHQQLYLLPSFIRDYAQDCILQKFQRRQIDQEQQQQQQKQLLPQKFGAGGDYKFVYAGTAASSLTDTHFDVCATYSFSMNLLGRKRWLFAADHTENERLRTLVFKNKPESALSSSAPAIDNFFEIIQNPGDLVFVPSLLVHRVENLASASSSSASPVVISFNHNWFAMPYSVPFLLKLLEEHTLRSLYLIGSDTVKILRGDQDDTEKEEERRAAVFQQGAGAAVPRSEFELIFNRFQNSSSAFSLSVVRALLQFAMRSEDEDEDEFVLRCTTHDAAMRALENALCEVSRLEKLAL